MMRWQFPIIAILLASMLGTTLYYRIQYKGAEETLRQVELEAKSRQAEIEQLSRQIQTISALDTQHTEEFEHDENLIAQLERDVATSRRRLHVKATCPAMPTGSPASRMDDATRSRPTDAAQRNYFTLRHRIEIAEQQINGLQDYIRQVVLSNKQENQK